MTATDPNRPMMRPGRVAIVAIGISLLVLLFVAVAATQDSSDVTGAVGGPDVEGGPGAANGAAGSVGAPRPPEVERVSPGPADVVGVAPVIKADLLPGYVGVLQIDGVEVPEDQLDRVAGLGEVTFRPGPGKDIEFLEAGVRRVRVIFWPEAGTRADDASVFDWSFRVAA